jgi:hypothetical protein
VLSVCRICNGLCFIADNEPVVAVQDEDGQDIELVDEPEEAYLKDDNESGISNLHVLLCI